MVEHTEREVRRTMKHAYYSAAWTTCARRIALLKNSPHRGREIQELAIGLRARCCVALPPDYRPATKYEHLTPHDGYNAERTRRGM